MGMGNQYGGAKLFVVLLLFTMMLGWASWSYANDRLPDSLQSWLHERHGEGAGKDALAGADSADNPSVESNAGSGSSIPTPESNAGSGSSVPTSESDAGSGTSDQSPDTANLLQLANQDVVGTWEGTLTFQKINLSEADKGKMTEEDRTAMEAALDKAMKLTFSFYPGEAGQYVSKGVIVSGILGDGNMDEMSYTVADGHISMTYSDSKIQTTFTATLGKAETVFSMDGDFSIKAVDGGGQSMEGVWQARQVTTELPAVK